MSTDWNWFFTSVSQSAAALVGIFGAFIISKILANQTAFSANKIRAQELMSEAKRLTDISKCLYFDLYITHAFKFLKNDIRKVFARDTSQSSLELYKQIYHNHYVTKDSYMQFIEKARQEFIKEKISRGAALIEPPEDIEHVKFTLGKKQEIDNTYTEVLHLRRVIKNYLSNAQMNPESSPVITKCLWLVLALFFVGVIYPLSFMPVPLSWTPVFSWSGIPHFLVSLRGILLIFISVIFSYMVGMFLNMNHQLKYPLELLQELGQYESLSTYSEFFANRETNEKANAEATATP